MVGADPELGTPLDFPLVTDDGAQRVLVVAMSGEGKSNLLDTIRERVTACRDARLFQINLSKGVEDSWWEPLTEASALATDTDPAAKAQAILDFAMAACKNRPRARAAQGGARQHQITDDEPLNVLMVDEADKAQADPERKALLEALASKCRSEGWALVLASQRPLGQWISPNLRANLSWIVWSKMRASDLAKAAGSDGFTLPDMGAYGGDNKGIFGSAQLPLHEGSPYKRGRTFFWGNDSAGMLQPDRRPGRRAGPVPARGRPGRAGDRLAQLWARDHRRRAAARRRPLRRGHHRGRGHRAGPGLRAAGQARPRRRHARPRTSAPAAAAEDAPARRARAGPRPGATAPSWRPCAPWRSAPAACPSARPPRRCPSPRQRCTRC